MSSIWPWIGFNLFVLAMLAIDLGVFHRKAHVVAFKEALIWSGVWIGLALAFNAGLFWLRGSQTGMEFLTGYVVEKSLSVDNIFVFLMLFTYFRVPSEYQHKVLFWGIIGALIFRAFFIWAGIALIEKFHWMIYVFGLFLIITGIKMVWMKNKKMEPERNPVLRLFRKIVPVTPEYRGSRFFVRDAGRLFATPLFVVLLLIETTDIIFAVDSIPAIIAITRDPFIVYTSNVFAILGLRSLFFALAGVMQLFHHLHYGLSAILIFVGSKMLVSDLWGKVPTGLSLGVIAGILALSVVASILFPPRRTKIDELRELERGEVDSAAG